MKKKKRQVLNRRVPRVTGSREKLQHRLPMELSNGLNYAERMLPEATKAGRASTLAWLAMEGLEKVIRDDYHNRALDRRRKAVEQMLNTPWGNIGGETWAMLHLWDATDGDYDSMRKIFCSDGLLGSET